MEKELLFEVYRVKNNITDEHWNPAIFDKGTHDITPLWVAGVLYAVYSRYIECLPDSEQLEYQHAVKSMFNFFIENGHGTTKTDKNGNF
jgi:hypothetical protein